MKPQAHRIMQLGELVAAAFDEAARRSSNPHEVSRWATRAVEHALRLGGKRSLSQAILAVDEVDGQARAKYLL